MCKFKGFVILVLCFCNACTRPLVDEEVPKSEGTSTFQIISSNCGRDNLRFSEYALWRIKQGPGFDPETSNSPLNETFWQLQQFDLSTGTCTYQVPVRFSRNLSVEQLSQWGVASAHASRILYQEQQSDVYKLFPSKRLLDIGTYGFGFLDLSHDRRWVCSIMFNALGAPLKCGFGFVRFRLCDFHTGQTILSTDCCYLDGRREFSGFVDAKDSLAYLIQRSMSNVGEAPSGSEALLRIMKNGRTERLQIEGLHAVRASPNGRSVLALIEPYADRGPQLRLYDASMRDTIWEVNEIGINGDEYPIVDLQWSADGCLAILAMGDGFSETVIASYSAQEGRPNKVVRVMSPRLTDGAVAFTPKNEEFDPFRKFGIVERDKAKPREP